VFTAASEDSTRVYVSMCDAGAIAVINTTDSNTNSSIPLPADSVVIDIPAAPGACNQPTCSTTASITEFSIASDVVTFLAANVFAPGQQVVVNGFSTGSCVNSNSSTDDTYLNEATLTVLPTGLSSTQFEAKFTHANQCLTKDSGNAVPVAPPQAPIFLITGQ
jgi:hypothetical protein